MGRTEPLAPLPTPGKGEKKDDFHSRCMGDSVMKREYPDQDQRNAVCGSQWRKKHGGKKPAKSREQGTGDSGEETETMELNDLAIVPGQEQCAAQHIGLWMIEPRWLADALAAVNAGHWLPIEAAAIEERRRPYQLEEDGLAVVPIIGQMTKGGSSFGGCSMLAARRAIVAAVQDPVVRAILLHIDSPGGTVAGTDALAQSVAQADEDKPVYAYIEDLGASAAYWVACQARNITANRTARVGSIGTMIRVIDTSVMAEKAGATVHVISTGVHKGAFMPGTEITGVHLAQLQKQVDSLNQHFLGAIYDGRGLPIAEIRELADGRLFMADEALESGLIDVIGEMDEAVPRDNYGHLADDIEGATFHTFRTEADEMPKGLTDDQKMEIAREVASRLSAEELRQHCAAVVAEIETAAKGQGVAQERERAAALARVTEEADLVLKAVIDGESPEQLEAAVGQKARTELKATREALAEKDKEITRLTGLNADGESAVDVSTPPDPGTSGDESDDDVLKANCRKEWDADPALHTEYAGNFGLYYHYRRATRDGLVKEAKKDRRTAGR